MPDLVIFDSEIQKLGRVKSGPIALELVRHARRIREKTKTNLGREYPPSGKIGSYPAKRSGRLQRSIRVSDPVIGQNGLLEVQVYTDAVSVHGDSAGHPYGKELLDRGYKFITDKDLASLRET